MVIGSRRNFVASAALVLAWSTGYAQQGSPFVGEWAGNVDGVGDARLIITGVKPSGQVEGRMEFALQSFVSTFGDKWNSTDRINHGVVSGSVLTIESALGGIYRLTLSGNQLAGSYTRGTTFSGTVAFKKII